MAMAVGAAGIGLAAYGKYQAGEAAQDVGQFKAAQYRVNAAESRAAGTRASSEEFRRSRLLQSRALALAAATTVGPAAYAGD